MLWEPAFFGVRPHAVLKGGMIAWAAMGDANASIPTPQPVLPRPMFGAAPRPRRPTSVHFVAPRPSRTAWPTGSPSTAGWSPVADDRRVGKADMPHNDALPRIEVDPDTFTVRIDGEVWAGAAGRRTADGPALLPVLMIAWRTLLVLADSRLPTGGHVHSGGVEEAIASGLVTDVGTLRAFLRRRIRTSGLVRHRWRRPCTPARCPSPTPTPKPTPAHRRPPRGGASRAQGRGLARLAGRVWPDADWDALGADPHLAVAAGAVGAPAG